MITDQAIGIDTSVYILDLNKAGKVYKMFDDNGVDTKLYAMAKGVSVELFEGGFAAAHIDNVVVIGRA